MKKLIVGTTSVLFLLLTIILAGRWYQLGAEQNAFSQMASDIASKKGEVNGYMSTGTSKYAVLTGEKNKIPERQMLFEYQELFNQNPDLAGWILIDGTSVNYPVMQTPDEMEYYLHRDFQGKESFSGTPFVGSGNLTEPGSDVFLYGHNMRNGTMFADVLHYQQKTFWEMHKIIHLDTLYEYRRYRVFSVFYADETEWSDNEGLFGDAYIENRHKEQLLKELRKRGLYETDADLNAEAPLLFLVTCSYTPQNSRMVIAAIQEDGQGCE